jgi:O-succinylbenzoic acid--CoA ligase
MISSGGENVFPDEIESTYATLTEIAQIAVVGVPDEKWGAVPIAFITFKDNKYLSQQDLRDFGREMLAHYKVPAKFYQLDEFPRTASGKVQRHKLVDAMIYATLIN